jgi:hypothetical protein
VVPLFHPALPAGSLVSIFYAACLTLYRFNLLVSNSVIPQNMKRFKWHILPLVRGLICGKANHALNSGQVEIAASRMVETMAQHGTAATEVFTKVTKICQDLGSVTPDQLKRQAILNEMLAKIP